MSRPGIRGRRGTVSITPAPAIPKQGPAPVAPPSEHVVETVNSLILNTLNSVPINMDKAGRLLLLLTMLQPHPLTEEETDEILTLLELLLKKDLGSQVGRLNELLQALVKNGKNLPPDQYELIVMNIPSNLVERREMDLRKAYFLWLLLLPLSRYPLSIEEGQRLLDLLRNPPSNLAELREPELREPELRKLLRRLYDNVSELPEGERTLIRSLIPLPIVTESEINQLKELRYPPPTGGYIVTLQDRSTLYEVINLIVLQGFPFTFDFLKRITHSDNILFDSPLMEEAQEKYRLDLDILTRKVQALKGTQPCPRCGSDNVLEVEKQVRSIDEGSTVFYTCQNCDKRWKH